MPKQIDPQTLETLKSELICTKYIRPEKVGSLYLPPMSREDKTGQLWEVVVSNPEADLIMGEEVTPGDILRVRWGHATDLGVENLEGRGLFLIRAEDVEHRIKNTWTR